MAIHGEFMRICLRSQPFLEASVYIDFDMIEWTWFGDGYDYCSQGDDVLVIRLSIEGLTSIN